MIGCGLALNDTGFILVQATCPTSSLSRSVTLFLAQVLEVCCGVTNEREKDGGARGPVGLWTKGPRETGAPMYAKYLSVCSVGIVRTVGCSIRWWLNHWRVILIGRERILFYR